MGWFVIGGRIVDREESRAIYDSENTALVDGVEMSEMVVCAECGCTRPVQMAVHVQGRWYCERHAPMVVK